MALCHYGSEWGRYGYLLKAQYICSNLGKELNVLDYYKRNESKNKILLNFPLYIFPNPFIKNPAKAVTQNITSPALMCLPSRSSSVKVVLTELGNEKIKLRTSLKMKYNIITTPKCIYMHVINRN